MKKFSNIISLLSLAVTWGAAIYVYTEIRAIKKPYEVASVATESDLRKLKPGAYFARVIDGNRFCVIFQRYERKSSMMIVAHVRPAHQRDEMPMAFMETVATPISPCTKDEIARILEIDAQIKKALVYKAKAERHLAFFKTLKRGDEFTLILSESASYCQVFAGLVTSSNELPRISVLERGETFRRRNGENFSYPITGTERGFAKGCSPGSIAF